MLRLLCMIFGTASSHFTTLSVELAYHHLSCSFLFLCYLIRLRSSLVDCCDELFIFKIGRIVGFLTKWVGNFSTLYA